MDKKTPNIRKRLRADDSENKIHEPQMNKLLKPFVDPLTIACENTIQLEEIEYKEVVDLERLPESKEYFEDPNNWTDLGAEDIKQIVSKGPIQIRDYSFPKKNNRKFTTSSYQRTLANGKMVSRTWLIYSKSQDCVYCFCCLLFATTKKSQSLSSTGCSDWPHLSAILKSHESSIFHLVNFKTWKFLEKSLALNKTIDPIFETSIRDETKRWKAVIQRLFTLVKFLGSQGLTFRGSSDDLYNVNNGNFLQLIEEVASFDSVLGEHMRRITSPETRNKYLSSNIQNEIINIISRTVTNKIVSMVENAKYFSIIVDSTTDKSLNEQVTIILRFVHNNNNTFEVKEHFLGFLKEDTTGEGLANLIFDKLELHEISLSNCRGQSYDSSSNIKATKSGTQNKISTLEPRALFVPCCSHSLSLVVNDLARCSLEAVKFFDVVKGLYNFLSSSTMRWEILTKSVPNLTLHPLSELRWESSLDALTLLKTNLGDIYEALVEISEKGNPEEKNSAELLGNKIDTTSKFLQNPSVTLSASIQALHDTKENLVEMRSDKMFNDYLQTAERIAIDLEIPPELPEVSYLRSRRIKREDDFEEFSETYWFKVEFYYKILDQALGSITERFEQLETYNRNFSILYNISGCSKYKGLRLACLYLQKLLSTEDSEDIDGVELHQELLVLSPLVKQNLSSLEVLNFIFTSKLEDLAPNVVIALQILNTLPVVVPPTECSFSKLELIQNHIRSTKTQERLEDLSIMAIENELVKSLDYDDLITEFAKAQAIKANLKD